MLVSNAKIIVKPFNHAENDYIGLLLEAIRKAGFEPVAQEGNRISCSAVLMNWFENVSSKEGLLLLTKKLTQLTFYKICRKKIIWVMHNRHPHEGKDPYSLFMMRFLARFSDRIMILCDDTIPALKELVPGEDIMRKVYKVPLVSYQSRVGNIPEKKRGETFNLLMFGRIQPYKCIETLIEAVSSASCCDAVRLHITGSCRDEGYVRKLQKMAENASNICIDARFISLEELKKLAADTDAFVLPMDQSSLNSSAVMMAFSLGRTAICPWIGTMREYADAEDFAYCYDYVSPQEHANALRRAIERAYADCMSSELGLSRQGKRALQNISNCNSIETVAEAFRKMIDSMK